MDRDRQRQVREIGPYRIIREVGRGGMGIVYQAVHVSPDRSELVAVKVLRPDLTDADLISRFRRERRILARLAHPNIARLLDTGTTADGPYVVMDYVDGLPIDRYSDERRLSISERLRLFLTVCAAVGHAHDNGIVHRDLKPANILMGADGAPRLLDFGIAKLLDPDTTASLDVTTTGQLLMTAEYASPEQVTGERISFSTDQYSLGVVLYQLVTGHPPYRLTSTLLPDIVRTVCEETPAPPSRVVGTEWRQMRRGGVQMDVVTPITVSATREGTPGRLRRRLQGDLDAILLKALAKQPLDRYTSVSALANDLVQHLAHRPVVARGDALAYKTGRLLKRLGSGLASQAAGRLESFGRGRAAPGETERDAALREAAELMTPGEDASPTGFDAAIDRLRRAATVLEELSRAAPDDADVLRYRSTASNRLAETLQRAGDVRGAIGEFDKAVRCGVALVLADPSDAQACRNLIGNARNLGKLYEHLASTPGMDSLERKAWLQKARRAYQRALDTCSALQMLGQAAPAAQLAADLADRLRRCSTSGEQPDPSRPSRREAGS